MTNMEERKRGAGHYHIEGFCALKAGRTWSVKREGCQADGTDDPNELAHYSSSLAMVRDYIWGAS
jgi:hypothetical protein